MLAVNAKKALEKKNLKKALMLLDLLYMGADTFMQAAREQYSIPCEPQCAACCHDCVFLTELEWYAILQLIAQREAWELLQRAIEHSKKVVLEHAEVFQAFHEHPRNASDPKWALLADVHYACPFLEGGLCQVYEKRELYGRLFGFSRLPDGHIYGCGRVREQFAADGVPEDFPTTISYTEKLVRLPYTDFRHLMPFFVVQTFASP